MKLQILVPHYNEASEEMEPLLDSIAMQQAVDFSEIGVVIAHDGDAEADDWCIPWVWDKHSGEYPECGVGVFCDEKLYPFRIDAVDTGAHVGVSAARNRALDEATADYVMFCDADDLFCDVCGLHIIFREIGNGGFDTLVSCFREETRDADGRPLYINHDMDSTFVHGKVHRREYLIEKGIRFDDRLTVHEDSYFNILARELAVPERAKYCPMPFYLWKWRDASVCRHDPDYILKTYGNMLDSNDALVREFERRGCEDKARYHVCFMVMDAYYTMNKPEWLAETHADYREAVERRFAEYWAEHGARFGELSEQERMQLSVGVRTRSAMEGMLMETVTLEQWLGQVTRLVERS